MFDKFTASLNESYYRGRATEALKEYQAQNGSTRLADLIDRLDGCRAHCRCERGACSECIDAWRRRAVELGNRLSAKIKCEEGCSTVRMTLTPDYGRVLVDKLDSFDIDWFRSRAENDLYAAGVEDYLFTIGVCHNGCLRDETLDAYQFSLWGICKAPREGWREQLKEFVNSTTAVTYPLVMHQNRSLNETIGYGMNSSFWGRAPYSSSSTARLVGALLVDLLLFLDSVPLQSRVLVPSAGYVASLPELRRMTEDEFDTAQASLP